MDIKNNKLRMGITGFSLKYVMAEDVYWKINQKGKYPAPQYIYEMDVIDEQISKMVSPLIKKFIPKDNQFKIKFLYARKANEHPFIVKHITDCLNRKNLKDAGVSAGIDSVSLVESYGSLKEKIKNSDILSTMPHMDEYAMRWIIENNITPTLGSVFELKKYAELSENLSIEKIIAQKMEKSGLSPKPNFYDSFKKRGVSARINLKNLGAAHSVHCLTNGLESHFGISENQFEDFVNEAKKENIKITGLHTHLGSGILPKEQKIFLKIIKKMLDLTEEYGLKDLDFIDFGSGFGTDYSPLLSEKTKVFKEEQDFDFNEFWGNAYDILALYAKKFKRKRKKEITFMFEPGRYLTARAGTLLGHVITIKTNERHNFACTNIGFTDLMRPRLYNSYHETINASNVFKDSLEVLLPGPKCESGDKINQVIVINTSKGKEERYKDVKIGMPKMGDIIAVRNAGSYGAVMASRYNGGPKATEVALFNDNKGNLMYKILFRETIRQAYKQLSLGETKARLLK